MELFNEVIAESETIEDLKTTETECVVVCFGDVLGATHL